MLSPPVILLVGALALVATAAACEPEPDADGGDERPSLSPRLTAVRGPAEHELAGPLTPLLVLSIEGVDLDPTRGVPIRLVVTTERGDVVDVEPVNTVTTADAAFGHAEVGLDLREIPQTPDAIRVCASADGVEGNPCLALRLLTGGLEECVEAFIQAKENNPDFRCRCVSGEIKRTAAERPDGSLGTFSDSIGGNVLGEFHKGNVRTDSLFSSTFKFEPHFTVEIQNDPGRPAACTAAQWRELSFGVLCSEGQEINKTVLFRIGRADSLRIPLKGPPPAGQADSVDVPYDPRPDARLVPDRHGYRSPGRSASRTVTGAIKAYDPENIIHWLDAPGANNATSKPFRGLQPALVDHYFHAFVHGTRNTDEDNCDCYFSIRSAVIDSTGAAGSASLSNLVCR